MHLRPKSMAAVAALALLPLAAVVEAAPAHAAGTVASSVSIDVATHSGMVGDHQSVSGEVSLVGDSGHAAEGTSYLQASTDGGRTWGAVATSTGSFAFFSSITKLVENVDYRIYFAGGRDDSDGTVFSPSYSPVVAVSVTRRHSEDHAAKGHGRATKILYTGTIKGWAKRRVMLQIARKPSGTWRKYKVARTDKKGAYAISMKAPATRKGQLFFRAVIPGDAHFTPGYGAIAYTFWRRTF
jgi:hypothetical protein